jgi:predicted ATP-dependent endonuclease of OLD family
MMILDTDSHLTKRILVRPGDRGTELQNLTGITDERLTEAASELGITKGDLLLMTRLAVFVEGPHETIILREWFGDELRNAGIRLFRAHGSDNFPELVNLMPGTIGSEIIGALRIRMAIIADAPSRLSKAGREPTVKRVKREAEAQGYDIATITLSNEDFLYYLDEEICRESAPAFPGWSAARDAARKHGRDAKWKSWITEEYDLELSRCSIARLAAECKRQGRIPPELKREIKQLTDLADSSRNRLPAATAHTAVARDSGRANRKASRRAARGSGGEAHRDKSQAC